MHHNVAYGDRNSDLAARTRWYVDKLEAWGAGVLINLRQGEQVC